MKTIPVFLNNLYIIQDIHEDKLNNRTIIQIELNPAHPIFVGHFPGNPVLPGVCTVQIWKELLAHHLNKDMVLKKAGTIKYMSFINPEVNRVINFSLQCKDAAGGQLMCNTTVFYEEQLFCSFKGEWEEM